MKEKFLEAGEVVSTHGIQGEIKILPWADSPEFLLGFHTLYLNGKPFAVQSSRVHKTCVLVKLEGVDTPESAALLRGRKVSIDRTGVTLPQGAVFIADLLGCRVLDQEDNELGTVADVLTMPANDVLVVKGTREYMIPNVKEFVKEIRVEEGCIRVRRIEGMATDEN